jgi:porphobilinogen synthase
MVDEQVAAIRAALPGTPILSYSCKFASAFYGPFREALSSAPKQGDRSSYQLLAGNLREALREADQDLAEGADMLMVKPGLPYLDVVSAVRERTGVPLAVYQVSGEYAMIKAAAEAGYLAERAAVLESLTAFRRAGADLIITYFAKEAATWL